MSDARSRQAWELAGRQHGIVARRQLLALGFSSRSIEHRCKTGRLHVVARGVYAVGWPALDRRRRWMAAVLACGEDAVLSHRSAAALLGIGSEMQGSIDVTVPRRCELRRPGLLIRGRPSLGSGDLGFSDGIPVTSPTRTLIDLTTELDIVAVERAVNDADKRDLVDPESLRAALDRYAGEPGVRPLRKLLDKLTFRLSDSDLEVHFRPIASAAGLSPPLSKQRVNGFEVDLFWPERLSSKASSVLIPLLGVVGGRRRATERVWGQAVQGRREPE
jgi:predicted transcriptional regulator of viral defense system